VWLEVYKTFGAFFKKKGLQECEYKIRYENEYFCRMRKEITTNYNYKEAGKYINITKSRKIAQYFFLNELPDTSLYFFFSWRYNPHWGLYFTALQWALASSLARFLDHTQRRATFGRTPLNE